MPLYIYIRDYIETVVRSKNLCQDSTEVALTVAETILQVGVITPASLNLMNYVIGMQ